MAGSYLLIRGDSARIPLADRSVHCVATSPPYWSLRDYGLTPSRWPAVTYRPMPGLPPVEIPAMEACLGLEPTPEAFVGHVVLIARELWRVLRDDGTLWLNFGDSYCGYHGNSKAGNGPAPSDKDGYRENMRPSHVGVGGLKNKDLVGIPWRIAFALAADGWYLRSDIIWAKPNPMPESVTDRPSKAHEYIFLLAKRPGYFYDVEAVREGDNVVVRKANKSVTSNPRHEGSEELNWKSHDLFHRDVVTVGRNRRTVWGVPTQSTPDAHFATWPERLVEPMILAGTSAHGCCPSCGAPWGRVVSKDRVATRPGVNTKITDAKIAPEANREAMGWNNASVIGNRDPRRHVTETKTVGWKPTCGRECGREAADPVPCVVLDPFNGSGTTGQVARRLGRSYVGIDLNPTYLHEIASARVEKGERPHKPRKARPKAELVAQVSFLD